LEHPIHALESGFSIQQLSANLRASPRCRWCALSRWTNQSQALASSECVHISSWPNLTGNILAKACPLLGYDLAPIRDAETDLRQLTPDSVAGHSIAKCSKPPLPERWNTPGICRL